jgi:tripartite-type tricarboxylate transporter receptor subunit TctC
MPTRWFGLKGGSRLCATRADVAKVVDRQEFREWMVNEGIESMYGGPVEFRALIVSEIDRLGKIVKLSGAKLE